MPENLTPKENTKLVGQTIEWFIAIAKAAAHGREVDWQMVRSIVNHAIDDGGLPASIYRGRYGEVTTMMKIIEVAFYSLEIDLNGDPLPGKKPWAEGVLEELKAEDLASANQVDQPA